MHSINLFIIHKIHTHSLWFLVCFLLIWVVLATFLVLEFWLILCLCYIIQVMLCLTNGVLTFWDQWVEQNYSRSSWWRAMKESLQMGLLLSHYLIITATSGMFSDKKCQAPVLDISIWCCSMNRGSSGCTRLAETRQGIKSLVFPFQSFTSAGMLETCRGFRCCEASLCFLQLAADIFWWFTSLYPSATEPGVMMKVPEILKFAGGTRTHKGNTQRPDWVPTQ